MTSFPKHEGVCTGAECPHCYPNLTKLRDFTCFRDSRGLPVTQFPTVLRPSATVILVHEWQWQDGPPWTVLVHQRSDNGWWGFPGGRQELGESLVDCALREAQEETGYEIYLLGAVAIDSDPCRCALVTYADGIVQYTNVTFLARVLIGTMTMSEESTNMRWERTDQLPEPFLPSHRWRLDQALAHQGPFLPVR